MSLVVPINGELQLLNVLVQGTNAANSTEAYKLRLFTNTDVPSSTWTTATPTEANFTGYGTVTLARASWGAATNVGGIANTVYATQSYTCGASGNTVQGYWVEGATSGTMLWAEKFGTARVLANGDVLNLTPNFTLQSA